MSKYYKADDVIRAIAETLAWHDNRTNRDKFDCIDGWEEWIENAEDFVYNLPTIEVSEDAISREGLLKHAYERDGVMCVSVESIKLAPSVIPQVPSEDAISREWAINKQKELIELYTPHKAVEGRGQVYWQIEERELVAKELEQAPSVTPKAKEQRNEL